MKLADFVVDFLAKEGIRHAFLISGGAVIHIVDSVARHKEMAVVCPQHEQAAGAAADMYARVTDNLGVAIVTSGPGATNLVTSVCNAYFDSVPCIFICGQVATFRLKPSEALRQNGFQETDVVTIFKSITKYAKQLKFASDIKYELQRAVYLAKSGRPGPVLLDIPDDLQRVEINSDELRCFSPSELSKAAKKKIVTTDQARELFSLIKTSKHPVLILGGGVRQARQSDEAIRFARYFHLPVLLTWGGMDLLPHDDILNMGGVGVCGPRAGNFAAQCSDLVIAMGTRLSQMITGGKQNLFAPNAKKVMIDIDSEELNKFGKETFCLDLALECSLQDLYKVCEPLYESGNIDLFCNWRGQIKDLSRKYPICPQEYYQREDKVNAYVFINELSDAARDGAIIITDAGGNLSWTMQAYKIKKDQRIFSAWNHSPMGYSLPASIGAAFGANSDVLCIIGDGGIMMCLEELGTIRRYDLPVKVFVFNNHGHGIQKQTIETWLNSHYVAVDESTGLYFPDFVKMGAAFGIPSVSINNHAVLKGKLREVLSMKGPVLCNVEIAEDQRIVPMLKFGAGLEDLDPKIEPDKLSIIMKKLSYN